MFALGAIIMIVSFVALLVTVGSAIAMPIVPRWLDAIFQWSIAGIGLGALVILVAVIRWMVS